jgi:hypothetical protein
MSDSDHEAGSDSALMCKAFVEELLAVPLGLFDACPGCTVTVSHHHRRPVVAASSSSSAAGHESSSRPSSGLPSSATSHLLRELPKWSKTSVCRTFLQRITQLLSTSEIAQEHWPKLLVRVVEDVSSAEWISDNIIAKKLSWKDACQAFTSHFQQSDYTVALRAEYRRCKQLKGESVQSYSDRFLNLIHELGIEENNSLVLDHFIENMSDYMYRKYQDHLVAKQTLLDDPTYAITSLEKIISLCIRLDVAQRTAAEHAHAASSRAGAAPTATGSAPTTGGERKNHGKRLHCKNHPQSTSHSTADCHMNKSTGSGASKHEFRPAAVKRDPSTVTCHGCGNVGHYANDPKCPKRAQKAASSASSGHVSVNVQSGAQSGGWKSPLPSSSSSEADQLRRSARIAEQKHAGKGTGPNGHVAARSMALMTQTGTAAAEHESAAAVSASSPAVRASRMLDRTLPSSVIVPASGKHEVLFAFRGQVYTTLLDTGADTSFIDSALVKELELPVIPLPGKVCLAQAGVTADRIGKTPPLEMMVLFPAPHLPMDGMCITHAFEILPLDSPRYRFILGTDLIPLLFPVSIPSAYIPAPALVSTETGPTAVPTPLPVMTGMAHNSAPTGSGSVSHASRAASRMDERVMNGSGSEMDRSGIDSCHSDTAAHRPAMTESGCSVRPNDVEPASSVQIRCIQSMQDDSMMDVSAAQPRITLSHRDGRPEGTSIPAVTIPSGRTLHVSDAVLPHQSVLWASDSSSPSIPEWKGVSDGVGGASGASRIGRNLSAHYRALMHHMSLDAQDSESMCTNWISHKMQHVSECILSGIGPPMMRIDAKLYHEPCEVRMPLFELHPTHQYSLSLEGNDSVSMLSSVPDSPGNEIWSEIGTYLHDRCQAGYRVQNRCRADHPFGLRSCECDEMCIQFLHPVLDNRRGDVWSKNQLSPIDFGKVDLDLAYVKLGPNSGTDFQAFWSRSQPCGVRITQSHLGYDHQRVCQLLSTFWPHRTVFGLGRPVAGHVGHASGIGRSAPLSQPRSPQPHVRFLPFLAWHGQNYMGNDVLGDQPTLSWIGDAAVPARSISPYRHMYLPAEHASSFRDQISLRWLSELESIMENESYQFGSKAFTFGDMPHRYGCACQHSVEWCLSSRSCHGSQPIRIRFTPFHFAHDHTSLLPLWTSSGSNRSKMTTRMHRSGLVSPDMDRADLTWLDALDRAARVECLLNRVMPIVQQCQLSNLLAVQGQRSRVGASVPCIPMSMSDASMSACTIAGRHSYPSSLISCRTLRSIQHRSVVDVSAAQRLSIPSHAPVPVSPSSAGSVLFPAAAVSTPLMRAPTCGITPPTAQTAESALSHDDYAIHVLAVYQSNSGVSIDSLSGDGMVPDHELPVRVQVSTPSEVESGYAAHRQRVLSDPEIVQALEYNAGITGFCNLPESMVRLEVDPTKESKLFRKQYPVAETLKPRVTEVIQRWHESGKICLAPPGCQYNNPLTVAPKKDDAGQLTGIRVCLDTRALNAALVVHDRFQLPYIRDTLEQFGGNTIFGEFDLQEAYLQFPMDPASQPYTAFTWNGVQYMFVGAPFGIATLPSHFQRVMSFCFSDLPFTFPYLDNLPFGSSNWDDHRDQALTIIDRLNRLNLKIKPSSVKVGHAQIRCLGHLLSSHGIGIDPDKLAQLADWPLPKTGEQLQSFLGFVTFLRQHVRHFADITAPLEAIKNHKDLEWNEHLLHHFHLTRHAVSHAPFLQFPDFSKPFHVATDASNTGVGGVLYQPDADDGDITPTNIVAVCSKKLTTSQRNYSAYKKELYGIVYCLRQFHTFIWGRNDVVLCTDHKPLTYMFQSAELSPALQQWLDVIVDYSFEIRHRPGILNVVPDTLSRMYAARYENTVWGIPSSVRGLKELLEEFGSDADPIVRVAAVTAPSAPGAPSPSSAAHPSDSAPSDFAGEGDAEASLTDTELDQSESSTMSLAVELEKRGKVCPSSDKEKHDLIETQHLFGHFGREAIFKALFRKGYWWPKMRADISEVLTNCDACTRFVVTKAGYDPASYITTDAPWKHIQLDTSVHLPATMDGYTALLVIIDVFTGFVILRPVRSTDAHIIADELWQLFCLFGLPQIIQSDNGPEFVNQVLRVLVKLTGLEHRFISPYNPRADGKVERSIGTVMGIIKKLLHGSDTLWPLFVPFAQLSFNHKISSLTGSSPFDLMFGRKMNEIKDYTDVPSGSEPKAVSLDNWKVHQEKIISVIYPAVSKRIEKSKKKMVANLNKHRRQLMQGGLPKGAVVMLIDPHRQNKFEPKYIGPYTIIRRARNGAYVLRDATGDMLDRHVPADQLKLISRKPRLVDLDQNTYEVQSILDHRGSPGSYEYHVKWKDHNARTWEPASSFLDDLVIKNYWKQVKAGAAGAKK